MDIQSKNYHDKWFTIEVSINGACLEEDIAGSEEAFSLAERMQEVVQGLIEFARASE
jgi:hypothetical protein|tara:strand:- start:564 stop:734 length:171 start_codon:yes stop_codon:yes gene_type:complete